MRGLSLFFIIMMLPMIAALGHDIYLFTENETISQAIDDVQAGDRNVMSYFASTGYLWTQYHPESLKTLNQSLDDQSWGIINKILTYKAFIIAFLLGLIVFCFGWIVNILLEQRRR